MKIIFKPGGDWNIRQRKNEKEDFLKRELAYRIVDLLKKSDIADPIGIKYHIIVRIALRPIKKKIKDQHHEKPSQESRENQETDHGEKLQAGGPEGAQNP